jgi:hypothetical protein
MEQTPEIIEVNTLALSVPDQAKQITTITNNTDYTRAGEILLTIKEIRKKIENTFKPIKRKMDAAKKEVLDQEKAADKPLAEAEAWIKPLISNYLAEQERIRKDEEDRLRGIARKEEEERQLMAAIEAEEEAKRNGATKEEAAAEAQIIIETPVQAAPVVVPKSVPKVAGVSVSKQWKFRIIDVNKIPREYLMPDEKAIGGVVTRTQGRVAIPGVEAYSVDVVSAGRRAA